MPYTIWILHFGFDLAPVAELDQEHGKSPKCFRTTSTSNKCNNDADQDLGTGTGITSLPESKQEQEEETP